MDNQEALGEPSASTNMPMDVTKLEMRDVLVGSMKVKPSISLNLVGDIKELPVPRTLKTPYTLRPVKKIKRLALNGNPSKARAPKKSSKRTEKVPLAVLAVDQTKESHAEPPRVQNGTTKRKRAIFHRGRPRQNVSADNPVGKSVVLALWSSKPKIVKPNKRWRGFAISQAKHLCTSPVGEVVDNAAKDSFEKSAQTETMMQDVPRLSQFLGLQTQGIKNLLFEDTELPHNGELDKNVQNLDGKIRKRKMGRPRKLVVMSSDDPEAGKEHERSSAVVCESLSKDSTTCKIRSLASIRVQHSDTQDASGTRAAKGSGDMAVKHSNLSDAEMSNTDDDQPISICFGRMRASRCIEGSSESMQGESRCLFAKSSPVWKMIESMDIFKMTPQKPHFESLWACKEEYREGAAIGIMVTFAGLNERILNLRLDDPRSHFDSCLETLSDMRQHGFDVTAMRCHVNNLLTIKERQVQLQDESKDAEAKITEREQEKEKLEEEIDEIGRIITKLQEKLATLKSEKESRDLEIARLKSVVDANDESLRSMWPAFEKLAAHPPWKFS